jgi:PAS domain S-box-containing protein
VTIIDRESRESDRHETNLQIGPRILIVEDERIVALDLQERLRELSYDVPAVAASGVQAVEMVEQIQPDLILMDIRLQGEMDGIETADHIRDKYGLPVVYLTAYSDQSTLRRARISEPFGYLVKPYDIENVRSTIEMALFRHRMNQRLKDNANFLAVLNDIVRAALETSSLSNIAQIAVERLRPYYRADICLLYHWDRDSRVPLRVAVDPRLPSKSFPDGLGSPDRLCEAAIERGRPLVIRDNIDDDLSFLGVDAVPTGSAMALPLISGNRKLGALLFLTNEPRNFSQEEVDRGEQIALHIALAFAEAQLVENLESTVLARTNEIISEKEKSETILRNVNHAIMMADQELIIRYINPAFTTLTGYTEEDALGQPAGSLGAGANSESLAVAIKAALDRGEGWHGDVVGQRKDGRTYDAALTLSPVFDSSRSLIGVVSSHQDISLQRSLERARNRFMSNVSHELRTPVTSILLYTHLLGTMENIPERSTRHLEILDHQVNRLKLLVEDVLEITGLDSGHTIENWDPVPLSFVIREVVDGFQGQAREANLTLSLDPVPSDLPIVMGDQMRLGQALAEIVENAVTFTPTGGQVKLAINSSTDEGVEGLAITVLDDGPGIPQDEIDSIFERFFRGSITEDGDLPGTGLGLSIAQEIVKAHGGRISVKSRLNEGSAFTVWLPANANDSQSWRKR